MGKQFSPLFHFIFLPSIVVPFEQFFWKKVEAIKGEVTSDNFIDFFTTLCAV